ncbi:MAG: polyprenyl synthetase family protein [Lachnospiraceae bacterium]|nr:polyprenyl synthetase family protein [Lachnospiraceae bacterium]
MDFKEELLEKTEYVNNILRSYYPKEEGFQKVIFEAMNYSVEAGGKRLRPIFMMEVSKIFDGFNDDVKPFMVALEMIHTYSLVHDDLPAMDNDDYRRGMLTTHKKYGHAMGVLSGDALLNYAFEIASEAVCEAKNMAASAKAMKVLSRKAGAYGMIGGQVVDVNLSGSGATKEQLDFIYENKTSALIEAAFVVGALLSGANDEQILRMEKAAWNIGMAFQIQDDILDVIGDAEVIGKPVLSDEKNEKTTYVSLYGIDGAKKYVKDYTDEAIKILSEVGKENIFLNELIISLINREK